MQVIPSIDLRRGQVVRLAQGDDARRTEYGVDAVAVVEGYARAGATLVHVVDLDAAFGEAPQHEVVGRIVAAARAAGVEVELGGGLRDRRTIEAALELGVARVVVGSMVARDPDGFASIARSLPGRIVPALESADGRVRVAGWREDGGVAILEAAERLRGLPCPAVLVTDVLRDGVGAGPNVELAVGVSRASGIPALVSGGVRSTEDLLAAGERPEIAGAVVGRALFEGHLALASSIAAIQSRSRGGARRPQAQSRAGARRSQGRTRLARRVIPCLDVAAGRVVKGVRFEQLRDQGDPAELAARYAAEGADEIVFLDVTAAPERRDTDLEWVRRTAERVFVPLTVGGGVRSVEDASRLLRAGADKVGVNSAAVDDPGLLDALAERFGSQCVVLSVDARRRDGEAERGWQVVTHGGRRPRELEAVAWIVEGVRRGAGEILLTSIDADGTQGGYDLELVAAVASAVSVPVIASGGAGSPDHLADALEAGAAAVLAASIFHERRWTVGETKERLAQRGFPVRRPKTADGATSSSSP